MIDGAPENIIWCYGMYQPACDEMRKSIPNISFLEGVPGDMETQINPSIQNLVVIDDLMHELSNDHRITNLFTKGCHHRSLRVIFVLQNIFHRGKELRDMSLNCHYFRRSRKRWYFCTASGGTSKNLELKGKFLAYLRQLS